MIHLFLLHNEENGFYFIGMVHQNKQYVFTKDGFKPYEEENEVLFWKTLKQGRIALIKLKQEMVKHGPD